MGEQTTEELERLRLKQIKGLGSKANGFLGGLYHSVLKHPKRAVAALLLSGTALFGANYARNHYFNPAEQLAKKLIAYHTQETNVEGSPVYAFDYNNFGKAYHVEYQESSDKCNGKPALELTVRESNESRWWRSCDCDRSPSEYRLEVNGRATRQESSRLDNLRPKTRSDFLSEAKKLDEIVDARIAQGIPPGN